MAIKWKFNITITDIKKKIARVIATWTDDSTTPPTVGSVKMESADISTSAKQAAGLDILWAKYEEQIVMQAEKKDIIGNLEAMAETNFEGRG